MTLNIQTVISKDQEPNPFEQSFSAVSTKFKTYAPPQLNSTGLEDLNLLPIAMSNQDSYSTVSDQHTQSSDSDDHHYSPPNPTHLDPTLYYSTKRTYKQTNSKSKKNRSTKLPEDEEKRKNFLERNRLAALKCRQRKKQWLNNLQSRVEFLTNDNDQLQMESEHLRKEIIELKTLLMAHKDCPQYVNALKSQNYLNPSQPILYHHSLHINDPNTK